MKLIDILLTADEKQDIVRGVKRMLGKEEHEARYQVFGHDFNYRTSRGEISTVVDVYEALDSMLSDAALSRETPFGDEPRQYFDAFERRNNWKVGDSHTVMYELPDNVRVCLNMHKSGLRFTKDITCENRVALVDVKYVGNKEPQKLHSILQAAGTVRVFRRENNGRYEDSFRYDDLAPASEIHPVVQDFVPEYFSMHLKEDPDKNICVVKR